MAWWRTSKDRQDHRDPGEEERRRPDDDEDAEEQPPAPALRGGPRLALYVTCFILWAGLGTLLHEAWWDVDRGLVSIFTPLLAAAVVERLAVRVRPEWDRHHDPDEAAARRRRGADQLGDAARPYWAREGAAAGERDPEASGVRRPGETEGASGEGG